jgi:sulfite reductase (ferredoxin)
MSRLNAEEVKTASGHLRGPLGDDLANDDPGFSAEGQLLLKFHGVYQQDDRDIRRARVQEGLGPAYSCMVRAGIPGGILRSEQYLAMDALADELGDGTLRVTTRQGLQYHFIAKEDLRDLISRLNANLVTTLAACGDVVRNVMACPAPLAGRDHEQLSTVARELAAYFKPKTRGYWDLWIDGEHAVSASAPPEEIEPLYGEAYLPRKFKLAFAPDGDNCVDVYANDIGIVASRRDGEDGYNLLVGGGMGMSHSRPEDTYPRLATALTWVPAHQLGATCEAIIATQRDLGNREDRQQARLKYTIDRLGHERFRAEVESRLGRSLPPLDELGPWAPQHDHLGWHRSNDETWFLGVHLESGRIADREGCRVRTALREAAQHFATEMRFTARQDVLLCGIASADRAAVDELLNQHGVRHIEQFTPLQRGAIACTALPTCGQALAESERVLQPLVDRIDKELAARDLGTLPLRLNMTGCPNGCARPYNSEIGIVGRSKRTYDIYVGGAVDGSRLSGVIATDVRLDDIPAALGSVFDAYRDHADAAEPFGDFCLRHGIAQLAGSVSLAEPRRRRGS